MARKQLDHLPDIHAVHINASTNVSDLLLNHGHNLVNVDATNNAVVVTIPVIPNAKAFHIQRLDADPNTHAVTVQVVGGITINGQASVTIAASSQLTFYVRAGLFYTMK